MSDLRKINTPKGYTAFAESRIGGRRENQDSYKTGDTPFGFLITVCDGMGGGPGGAKASSIAVNTIVEEVMRSAADDTPSNVLIKAIRQANMNIVEYGEQNPAYRGMGSTCTALLISETSAVVAYVGDSRVYQIRGRRKVYRTFDHSMVFELVKVGTITEEQARLSAQSNIITRALGIKYDVDVACIELPYRAHDRFLLCTDGIHGALPEKELIKLVGRRKQSLGVITDDIATVVDYRGKEEGGGHDNLTLAILETDHNSKLKEKMNPRLKLLFYLLVAVCAISVCLNIFQGISKGSKAEGDITKQLSEAKAEIKNLQDSVVTVRTLHEDFVKCHSEDSTRMANEISDLQSQLDVVRKVGNGSQTTQTTDSKPASER